MRRLPHAVRGFPAFSGDRQGPVRGAAGEAARTTRTRTIRSSGPVDADDFRVNGDNASDFSNLVENGLVRVTMPLPLNVKLIDPATGQPSDETSVDLWRAVMPVFNVAITGPDGVLPIWPPGAPRVPIMGQDPNGPNRQGGYQHDARFATLQEQARGALFAHAQVTVEPPARMLDDLAAFQQTLFSSPGVETLADAIRSGSTLP